MRAECIADNIVKAVNDTAFDLVVATSPTPIWSPLRQLEPTIRACEVIDTQLERIYKAIRERNGAWLITADHGNAS